MEQTKLIVESIMGAIDRYPEGATVSQIRSGIVPNKSDAALADYLARMIEQGFVERDQNNGDCRYRVAGGLVYYYVYDGNHREQE